MNSWDIQKEIAEILTQNGFNVVASEVNEGFKKPAVFVNVYPVQHERLMCDMEKVVNSIEIKYIPAVETVAECVKTSEKLAEIFYYSPFTVCGCTFTVESIESETEDYTLYVSFEIAYEQPMPYFSEYDDVDDIKMDLKAKTEVE